MGRVLLNEQKGGDRDFMQHNAIVNFIWGIADDCLRDVILPMMVIRRIDALLEPTKQAVLKMMDAW